MKKYIVLGLLIVTALTSCLKHVSDSEKREFADSMAKALHLEFINTDPEYASPYFQIFNDTIVGFNAHAHNNKNYYEYYFVQSIKNLKYKLEIDNDSLIYPSISKIDYYKNGKLYFGRFGGSNMQTLDLDGNLTEYFRKYEDTLFYANKVMLYKNMTVVTSMNGVYVFDLKSERLLWKYQYNKDFVYDGISAIIGKNLIFDEAIIDTTTRESHTNLICFDLEKLQIKWSKNLNRTGIHSYDREYSPHHQFDNDNGNVVILQGDTCYAFDSNTGVAKGKHQWQGNFNYTPTCKVENNKLYTDSKNNLLCADIVTGKTMWKLKDVAFWGLYKNYVIGYTPDNKYYLIIDKFSGVVKNKVKSPERNRTDFNIVGNYILINRESLYQ